MSFESGVQLEIEDQMAASEAHWQIEVFVTHIRPLKNQLHLMEDEFRGVD